MSHPEWMARRAVGLLIGHGKIVGCVGLRVRG